jgi:orotidine-5'-phosphate decarboxylase
MRAVLGAGGSNILINVGRDIIYDKNPGKKAREYQVEINQIVEEFRLQEKHKRN